VRYETRTKLLPREVLARARQFFGIHLGLTQDVDASGVSTWQGGGGMGSISFPEQANEKETTLELVTTEWDAQVREFMRRIGGHG